MLYNQGKKATSKLKMVAGFVGAIMMSATAFAANITVTTGGAQASSADNAYNGGDTVLITLTNVGSGETAFQSNGTGYLANGISAAAQPVLTVDTGTGSFYAGDTLTIGSGTYTVLSTTVAASVTSITFTTNLSAPSVDNETVTVTTRASNIDDINFVNTPGFGSSITVLSPTTLTTVTPDKVSGAAGPCSVIVDLNSGGPYSVINGYTYQPRLNAFNATTNPSYQTIAVAETHHNQNTRPVTGEGWGFTFTGVGFAVPSSGSVFPGTVTVDGVACSGLTVNGAGTQIVCTIPAAVTSGAGSKTIVVTNPNGTTCSGTNFIEYLPTITSIDVDGGAAEGPVGGATLLTVHGTGFLTGATSLTIGANGSPRTSIAANATAGGLSAAQINTSVSDTAVTLDDRTAAVSNIVIVDDTTLTCTVDTAAYADDNESGEKLVTISVVNGGITKTNYQDATGYHTNSGSGGSSFRFIPTINANVINSDGTTNSASGIQPVSGEIAGGYLVAINGTGFLDANGADNVSVAFGSQNAPVLSNNGTQLLVLAPAGMTAGYKNVVVTVEDGTTDPSATQTRGFAANAGAPTFAYDQTRLTNSTKTGAPAAAQDLAIGVGIPMDPFRITASNFPIFYDCTIAPNTANLETSNAITSSLSSLGLTLNQTTGVISGTPNRAGYYVFYVTAANTDSNNVVSKVRTEVRLRFGLFNVNSPKFLENPYANPNPAAVNTPVTFAVTTQDVDADANTYFWSFGADESVTDENRKLSPTHTYTAAGTYSVSLTIWDGIGTPATRTFSVVVDAAVNGTKLVVQSAQVNFDFKKSATKSYFYAKGLMDIPTKTGTGGFSPGVATIKVLGPSTDAFTPTSDTDTAAALADDTLTNDIVAINRTGATYGLAAPTIKGTAGKKNATYTWGDSADYLKLKVLTVGAVTGRASFEVTLKDDPTLVNTPTATLFGQMGNSEGGLGYRNATIKSKNKQQVANRLVLNLTSLTAPQNPSLNNQYNSFLMDYTCVAYKVGKGQYKQGK